MIHNRHQPESAATSRQLLQASHHAPITSNGVGTHYHGKKHRTIRHAVCRHCGHQAELTSYETRLWFVFMFIPLIPLGRKRIVDERKLCDRHESMPAQYWDNVRQSATVAATERFQEEQSEQSALEVHATLLEFQQHAEAQQFRSTMLDRFSDKPLLHTGLAMHLERIGLPEEANKLWDRAWQLDPELPEARVGMGRRRMSDRQLDAARELIAFLLEPGAEHDHDLAPTLELARHYQDAGEHEKAVEIMKILVTASPEFGHVHQIRTAINKLETAEREEDSILPTIETAPSKLSSP